jgi:hypothetical protein
MRVVDYFYGPVERIALGKNLNSGGNLRFDE